MAGPFTFAFTALPGHGAELPQLSVERAFYVVLFVGVAAGFGGMATGIAFPHRVEGSAVAVALAVAGLGLYYMAIPQWRDSGSLELVPFTYTFVVPAAYLLGALLWQRRKHTREGPPRRLSGSGARGLEEAAEEPDRIVR